MKKNRCFYNIVSIIINLTFLWSNLVWAGGVDYYKLGVSSKVTALVPIADAFATGQEFIKNVSRFGIKNKNEFYRKIGEELRKGRIEELSGMPCLVFSDQLDESRLAYYVFNPNEPYFSRITTHKDVNDSFLQVLKGFLNLSSDLREFSIDRKIYYQQIFAITDKELDFINTCIEKIYPEWLISLKGKGNDPAIEKIRVLMINKGFNERVIDEFMGKIKPLLSNLDQIAELLKISFEHLYMIDEAKDEIYYFCNSIIKDLPELLRNYPSEEIRNRVLRNKIGDLKKELLKEDVDKDACITRNIFSWLARAKEDIFSGEISRNGFGKYFIEVTPNVLREIVSFNIESFNKDDKGLMKEWYMYGGGRGLITSPRYNEWEDAISGKIEGFKLVTLDKQGKKRIEGWIVFNETIGEGIYEGYHENAPWNKGDKRETKGIATTLRKRLIEESVFRGYNGRLISIPATEDGIRFSKKSGKKPAYTPITQYGKVNWSYWTLEPSSAIVFLIDYYKRFIDYKGKNIVAVGDWKGDKKDSYEGFVIRSLQDYFSHYKDKQKLTPEITRWIADACADLFVKIYGAEGRVVMGFIDIIGEIISLEDESLARPGTSALFGRIVEALNDTFLFENRRISMQVLTRVIWILTNSPKGVSARDTLNSLGITSEEDLLNKAYRAIEERSFSGDYNRVKKIMVFSRVTKGADVAINSIILKRVRDIFPNAEVVLLGIPKDRELFGGDNAVRIEEIDYERRGSFISRLNSWANVVRRIKEETEGLTDNEYIVIDADTRISQVGVLPCTKKLENCFFLLTTLTNEERESTNTKVLGEIVNKWIDRVFGEGEFVYPNISLKEEDIDFAGKVKGRLKDRYLISISLGVGGPSEKKFDMDFDLALIERLQQLTGNTTILLDKGTDEYGEPPYVTELINRLREKGKVIWELIQGDMPDGIMPDIIVWEGSLGGFSGLISISDQYIGYDSCFGHIAGAVGVPETIIFKGHPNEVFLRRWQPMNKNGVNIVEVTNNKNSDEVMDEMIDGYIMGLINKFGLEKSAELIGLEGYLHGEDVISGDLNLVRTAWGGHEIEEFKGIELVKTEENEGIGESWELSSHRSHPSYLITRNNLKIGFPTLFKYWGNWILGNGITLKPTFVKILNSSGEDRGNLSVQAHPTDEYARIHENDSGKVESWIILDAEPDSVIYLGFKEDVNLEEFKRDLKDEDINIASKYMNIIPVGKILAERKRQAEEDGGKHEPLVLYIPHGTAHAIGKGILLVEVQQTSGVTYRVWDWNREPKRELHIDKALEVMNFKKTNIEDYLVKCDQLSSPYISYKIVSIGEGEVYKGKTEGVYKDILCLGGRLRIKDRIGKEIAIIEKGQSVLVPASMDEYVIENIGEGDVKLVVSWYESLEKELDKLEEGARNQIAYRSYVISKLINQSGIKELIKDMATRNTEFVNVLLGLKKVGILELDKDIRDLDYFLRAYKYTTGYSVKLFNLGDGRYCIYDENYLRYLVQKGVAEGEVLEDILYLSATQSGLEQLILWQLASHNGLFYELLVQRVDSEIEEVSRKVLLWTINYDYRIKPKGEIPIDVLFMPSYKRPTALRRALELHTGNMEIFGHRHIPILVCSNANPNEDAKYMSDEDADEFKKIYGIDNPKERKWVELDKIVVDEFVKKGFSVRYIDWNVRNRIIEDGVRSLISKYQELYDSGRLPKEISDEVVENGSVNPDKIRKILEIILASNISGIRNFTILLGKGKRMISVDDDALPRMRVPKREVLEQIIEKRSKEAEKIEREFYKELGRITGENIRNRGEYFSFLQRMKETPDGVKGIIKKYYSYSEDGKTGLIPQALGQIVRERDTEDYWRFNDILRDVENIYCGTLPTYLVTAEDVMIQDVDKPEYQYDEWDIDYMRVLSETLGSPAMSPLVGWVFQHDKRGVAGDIASKAMLKGLLGKSIGLATTHFNHDQDWSGEALLDAFIERGAKVTDLQRATRKAIHLEVGGYSNPNAQFCFNTTSIDNSLYPVPTIGEMYRTEEPYYTYSVRAVTGRLIAWSRTVGGHHRIEASTRPSVPHQLLNEEVAMIAWRLYDKAVRDMEEYFDNDYTNPPERIRYLGKRFIEYGKDYQLDDWAMRRMLELQERMKGKIEEIIKRAQGESGDVKKSLYAVAGELMIEFIIPQLKATVIDNDTTEYEYILIDTGGDELPIKIIEKRIGEQRERMVEIVVDSGKRVEGNYIVPLNSETRKEFLDKVTNMIRRQAVNDGLTFLFWPDLVEVESNELNELAKALSVLLEKDIKPQWADVYSVLYGEFAQRIEEFTGIRFAAPERLIKEDLRIKTEEGNKLIEGYLKKVTVELVKLNKPINQISLDEFNKLFGVRQIVLAGGLGQRYSPLGLWHKALGIVGDDETNIKLAVKGAYNSKCVKPIIVITTRILQVLLKDEYRDKIDDVETGIVDEKYIDPVKKKELLPLDAILILHKPEEGGGYGMDFIRGVNAAQELGILDDCAYVQIVFSEMATNEDKRLSNTSLCTYLKAVGEGYFITVAGRKDRVVENKGTFTYDSNGRLVALTDWKRLNQDERSRVLEMLNKEGYVYINANCGIFRREIIEYFDRFIEDPRFKGQIDLKTGELEYIPWDLVRFVSGEKPVGVMRLDKAPSSIKDIARQNRFMEYWTGKKSNVPDELFNRVFLHGAVVRGVVRGATSHNFKERIDQVYLSGEIDIKSSDVRIGNGVYLRDVELSGKTYIGDGWAVVDSTIGDSYLADHDLTGYMSPFKGRTNARNTIEVAVIRNTIIPEGRVIPKGARIEGIMQEELRLAWELLGNNSDEIIERILRDTSLPLEGRITSLATALLILEEMGYRVEYKGEYLKLINGKKARLASFIKLGSLTGFYPLYIWKRIFDSIENTIEVKFIFHLGESRRVFTLRLAKETSGRQKEITERFLFTYLYNLMISHGADRIGIYTEDSEVTKRLTNILSHKFPSKEKKGKPGYSHIRPLLEKVYGKKVMFYKSSWEEIDRIDDRNVELIEEADLPFLRLLKSPKGVIAGIDAGGTDIKVVIYKDGKLVYAKEHLWDPKQFTTAEGHIETVERIIRKSLEEIGLQDDELAGIGISWPEIVIGDKMIPLSSKVKGIRENKDELERIGRLKDEVSKRFGNVSVAIANDGNIGAFWAGVELGKGNLIGIAMGTSCGVGYIDREGRITDMITDMGSTVMNMTGKQNTAHNYSGILGVAQKHLSQDGVFRLAEELGLDMSGYEKLAIKNNAEKLKYIQSLLDSSDEETREKAEEIFREIGRYLACFIEQIYYYFDESGTRNIVLFGRVINGKAGKIIIETARQIIKERFIEIPCTNIYLASEITDNPDADRFGQAIGAVYLGYKRLLEERVYRLIKGLFENGTVAKVNRKILIEIESPELLLKHIIDYTPLKNPLDIITILERRLMSKTDSKAIFVYNAVFNQEEFLANLDRPINIVMFRGGRGASEFVKLLKGLPNVNISSVLAGTDDGRSWYYAAQDFNATGMPDCGKTLLDLAEDKDSAMLLGMRMSGNEDIIELIKRNETNIKPEKLDRIIKYVQSFIDKFKKDYSWSRFSLNNIPLRSVVLVGAAWYYDGDWQRATDEVARLLHIRPENRIAFSTLSRLHLVGLTKDGVIYFTETGINEHPKKEDIIGLWLFEKKPDIEEFIELLKKSGIDLDMVNVPDGMSPDLAREVLETSRVIRQSDKVIEVAKILSGLSLSEGGEIATNPVAGQIIQNADIIMYGPSTLESNIGGGLLPKGVQEAIAENIDAVKIFFVNPTVENEPIDVTAYDMAEKLYRYMTGQQRYKSDTMVWEEGRIDYVIGRGLQYIPLDPKKRYIPFNNQTIEENTDGKVLPVELNIEWKKPILKERKDYKGYEREYGFYSPQVMFESMIILWALRMRGFKIENGRLGKVGDKILQYAELARQAHRRLPEELTGDLRSSFRMIDHRKISLKDIVEEADTKSVITELFKSDGVVMTYNRESNEIRINVSGKLRQSVNTIQIIIELTEGYFIESINAEITHFSLSRSMLSILLHKSGFGEKFPLLYGVIKEQLVLPKPTEEIVLQEEVTNSSMDISNYEERAVKGLVDEELIYNISMLRYSKGQEIRRKALKILRYLRDKGLVPQDRIRRIEGEFFIEDIKEDLKHIERLLRNDTGYVRTTFKNLFNRDLSLSEICNSKVDIRYMGRGGNKQIYEVEWRINGKKVYEFVISIIRDAQLKQGDFSKGELDNSLSMWEELSRVGIPYVPNLGAGVWDNDYRDKTVRVSGESYYKCVESNMQIVSREFVPGITLEEILQDKTIPQEEKDKARLAALNAFIGIWKLTKDESGKGIFMTTPKPNDIVVFKDSKGDWQARIIDLDALEDGISADRIMNIFLLYPWCTQKEVKEMLYGEELEKTDGPKVVSMGGGNGPRRLAIGMEKYTRNMTNVITVFDNGGSTGVFRDFLDIPAVGDLRNRICVLLHLIPVGGIVLERVLDYRLPNDIEQHQLIEKLQNVIIEKEKEAGEIIPEGIREELQDIINYYISNYSKVPLKEMSVGNIILASEYFRCGKDLAKAVSNILRILGLDKYTEIIPVTEANFDIAAQLGDGKVIYGEHQIAHRENPYMSIIDILFTERGSNKKVPLPSANPGALEKIREADAIVIGPGSLYTSCIPNLMVKGVSEALRESRGAKILVINLLEYNEREGVWETRGYNASRIVEAVLRAVRESDSLYTDYIDYILVNNHGDKKGYIPANIKELEGMGFKVVVKDLEDKDSSGYHDPVKLSKAIMEIIEKHKNSTPMDLLNELTRVHGEVAPQEIRWKIEHLYERALELYFRILNTCNDEGILLEAWRVISTYQRYVIHHFDEYGNPQLLELRGPQIFKLQQEMLGKIRAVKDFTPEEVAIEIDNNLRVTPREEKLVLFNISLRPNGKVKFQSAPAKIYTYGGVIYPEGPHAAPGYSGVTVVDTELQSYGLIRGTISSYTSEKEGFVRLDPSIDDVKIEEIIGVIKFLAKVVNPGKKFILYDSVKIVFRKYGIVIPDDITIGEFISLIGEFSERGVDRTAEDKGASKISGEQIVIKNKLGLHAKVAVAIVKFVSRYEPTKISIRKGDKRADAGSLSELLMFAAEEGDVVEIFVEGCDESTKEEIINGIRKILEKEDGLAIREDDKGFANPEIIGNKGASLMELANLVPVPESVFITKEAYNLFIEESGLLPLIKDVEQLFVVFKKTESAEERGKILLDIKRKVKEIYDSIMNNEMPSRIEDLIKGEYKEFSHRMEVEDLSVAVRSSSTLEDILGASFAGIYESYLYVTGEDNVVSAVKKVWASLFSERATVYIANLVNEGADIPAYSEIKQAVVIQKMIYPEVSGVAYATGDFIYVESSYGVGSHIVDGKVTPDAWLIREKDGGFEIVRQYRGFKSTKLEPGPSGKVIEVGTLEREQFSLTEEQILELAGSIKKIRGYYEGKYGYINVDIEFALDNKGLYFLQVRPAEGIKFDLKKMEEYKEDIIQGIPVCPGIAVERIVYAKTIDDLPSKDSGSYILLCDYGDSNTLKILFESLDRCGAIGVITRVGGYSSHFASVVREIGIPYVSGIEDIAYLGEDDFAKIDGINGYVEIFDIEKLYQFVKKLSEMLFFDLDRYFEKQGIVSLRERVQYLLRQQAEAGFVRKMEDSGIEYYEINYEVGEKIYPIKVQFNPGRMKRFKNPRIVFAEHAGREKFLAEAGNRAEGLVKKLNIGSEREQEIRVISNRMKEIMSKKEEQQKGRGQCNLCPHWQLQIEKGFSLGNYIVYPNPFPYVDGLVTIAHKNHVPQRSTDLEDMLEFAKESGYKVIFNSKGAGPSVPEHRHYQAFPASKILPAEMLEREEITQKDGVKIYGLDKDYPVRMLIVEGRNKHKITKNVRNIINYLEKAGFAYNLLIKEAGGLYQVYIVPRTIESPSKYFGKFAVMEMLGELISPNTKGSTVKEMTEDDFKNEVINALQMAGIPDEDFDKLIRILEEGYYLSGLSNLKIRAYVTDLMTFCFGQFGISREEVEKMVEIIARCSSFTEAKSALHKAGFRWGEKGNRYYEIYRRYKKDVAPDTKYNTLKEYIRRGGFGRNAVVIDIGCGNHEIAKQMIDEMRREGIEEDLIPIVIGVDFAEDPNIQDPYGKIKYIKQDEKNPGKVQIEGESVADKIFIFSALHHMSEDVIMSIFSEAKRLLKPDGELIVFEDVVLEGQAPEFDEEDLATGKVKALTEEERRIAFTIFDWHANCVVADADYVHMPGNYFTESKWREVFRQAGFYVDYSRYVGVYKQKFSNLPHSVFVLKKKHKPIGDGFIMRGDSELLYQKLEKQKDKMTDLRQSISRKELVQRLREILDQKRIGINDTETIVKIEQAISDIETFSIREFSAIVLGTDKPKPERQWLLGFNSLAPPMAEYLQQLFPNPTLGYARQVLNNLSGDALLEYLLHEALCRYTGHYEARRIQEILFEETNYKDAKGELGKKEGVVNEVLTGVIRMKIYSEFYELKIKDGRLVDGCEILGERGWTEKERAMIKETIDRLVAVYGYGIFAVIDKIKVVDAIPISDARYPIPEGNGNVLFLNIHAFEDADLLYTVLEHKLMRNILNIIPCENDAVRELTTNYMSLKLALERGVKIDKEMLGELGVDLEFYGALEVLQAMKNVTDNDIIAVAIEHMRGMPYYAELFRQFSFAKEWEKGIKDTEERYRSALRVFNDIMEAKKGLERTVEEVDINVKVVKTFTGKMRILGLEGLPRNLQEMIGAMAKLVHCRDRLAGEMTRQGETKYILVDKHRLDEMDKDGYNEVVRELSKNNYQVVTELPSGVDLRNVIHLVDPSDLEGMQKREGMLYLPMPYIRSSFYIAAHIVAVGGDFSRIDPLVKELIKGLYKGLNDDELGLLFKEPWRILPKIQSVISDMDNLRKAIAQIEAAA